MVNFTKNCTLLCLAFPLFPLYCMTVHDVDDSCALEPMSTQPSSLSEACKGRSLLQTHSRRGAWPGIQNVTDTQVLGPASFRDWLAELRIFAICVGLFACAYLYCRSSTKQHFSVPGVSSASAETGRESLLESVPFEPHAAARSLSLDAEALASNETSDTGDGVVGTGYLANLNSPLRWQSSLYPSKYNPERIPSALHLSNYDSECIPKYIDEHFSSWKLLMQVTGYLAHFLGALAFMYWSLLASSEELMDCDAYPPSGANSFFVIHACHYTLACLQGFPVLTANIILVLMIRTLLQTRFYYSMLRSGFIVTFQASPIMYTMWPYVIGFSMLQGGLHFALKAWLEPDNLPFEVWARLLRKFVLPGSIFFSMLFKYADVEKTLVPLNRIAELDLSQAQNYRPWLANAKVVNERVIAFHVRHRDLYSDTMTDIGRAPRLRDLMQSVINSYESASRSWSARKDGSWGLFRSMWPAELLMNCQLDWNDKETRSWLQVSFIVAGASATLSLLSAYSLLAALSSDKWQIFAANIKSAIETRHVSHTATNLALVVNVCHAVLVIVLMVKAIRGMFYFSLTEGEAHETMKEASEGTRAEVDKAVEQFVQSLKLKGASGKAYARQGPFPSASKSLLVAQ